jgi:hypothetical protein
MESVNLIEKKCAATCVGHAAEAIQIPRRGMAIRDGDTLRLSP